MISKVTISRGWEMKLLASIWMDSSESISLGIQFIIWLARQRADLDQEGRAFRSWWIWPAIESSGISPDRATAFEEVTYCVIVRTPLFIGRTILRCDCFGTTSLLLVVYSDFARATRAMINATTNACVSYPSHLKISPGPQDPYWQKSWIKQMQF